MPTKTTTKNTDYTLREPNIQELHDKWCRQRLADDLVRGWQSKTEVRKFWRDQLKRNRYFKVVLTADITLYNGQRIARKGDTAWATYSPYWTGGIMVRKGTTKKQIEALRAAHFVVRILAPRKLNTNRPMYKGEPFHWEVSVDLNKAKRVK